MKNRIQFYRITINDKFYYSLGTLDNNDGRRIRLFWDYSNCISKIGPANVLDSLGMVFKR